MKTTLAALLAMLVGGLIGCADWGHNDDHHRDRDRDRAQGMYADDEAPMTRGGPRDDWTRLQDDPVCGRTVNPKTSVTEWYDNQNYYFHDEDCAKKFKDNPQAYLPGAENRETRDATVGMVKDPVCGMDVNPNTAKWTEEYDHKKYYFDSKDCARKFKDNPHAYLPGGDDRPGMRNVR